MLRRSSLSCNCTSVQNPLTSLHEASEAARRPGELVVEQDSDCVAPLLACKAFGLEEHRLARSPAAFETIDRSRQSTAGKARLRHDVVFLGRGKCCLTEEVLGAAHVDRVMYGPKSSGGVPEAMQIDAESEGSLGALLHGDIYGVQAALGCCDVTAKGRRVYRNPGYGCGIGPDRDQCVPTTPSELNSPEVAWSWYPRRVYRAPNDRRLL